MNYDEIRQVLNDAEQTRNKIAMFHLITLRFADDFLNEDPKAFCKAVGMQESYATEFLKMRALHLLLKEKNLKIQ